MGLAVDFARHEEVQFEEFRDLDLVDSYSATKDFTAFCVSHTSSPLRGMVTLLP